MRLPLFTLICSLIFTGLNAQWGSNFIKLSKNITTESKAISGFDKLEVSEDFEVYIHFENNSEKVSIEANENLHDLIEVEKIGTTLKISTKPYSTRSGFGKNSGAKERLVAHITAKHLTSISGDEDVIFELEDKLQGDELSIDLNEDCTLKGHVNVNKLKVKLDEDSVLDIKGSAINMIAHADEDCTIDGEDFVVSKLKIELTEDSEARLTVNGDIDLKAQEDSYFYHKGNGKFIRKKLRGDSEVRSL